MSKSIMITLADEYIYVSLLIYPHEKSQLLSFGALFCPFEITVAWIINW